MIQKAFVTWWNGLNFKDSKTICELASSEAWYQFEFGKYYATKYSDKILLENHKRDIIINDIQIECKMITNNKNIKDTINKIIKDGKRIKENKKGGYLALFIAFFNKNKYPDESMRFYPNTCSGWKLQPNNRYEAFADVSDSLWKLMEDEIRNKLKLNHNPKILLKNMKYMKNTFWHGTVLWKVK